MPTRMRHGPKPLTVSTSLVAHAIRCAPIVPSLSWYLKAFSALILFVHHFVWQFRRRRCRQRRATRLRRNPHRYFIGALLSCSHTSLVGTTLLDQSLLCALYFSAIAVVRCGGHLARICRAPLGKWCAAVAAKRSQSDQLNTLPSTTTTSYSSWMHMQRSRWPAVRKYRC